MTVLPNKWDGQQFNDPACLCDWCGKLGTVKLISVKCINLSIGSHLRKICKNCLLAMVAEIDQAVLVAASDGKVKGDDACKECDGLGKISAWLHEGVQVIGCPTCEGKGRKNPVRKEGS